MSLTRSHLRVAVRVMGYYNSVPLTGAVQTTSLLVVMIVVAPWFSRRYRKSLSVQ